MKVLFFALLLSFPVLVQGQHDFAHMFNAKLNFMVRGIENPIDFCLGDELKDIKVKSGRWKANDDLENYFSEGNSIDERFELIQKSGTICVTPDCDAKTVEITLVDVNGLEFSKLFYLKNVDLPLVYIGGKGMGDTLISRGEVFASNFRIYTRMDPSYYFEGILWSVVSFNVDLVHLGERHAFHCYKNEFSGACIELMNEMRAGDSIVIYDVEVTQSCGVKSLSDRIELLIQ
jgi:hypothetical protein